MSGFKFSFDLSTEFAPDAWESMQTSTTNGDGTKGGGGATNTTDNLALAPPLSNSTNKEQQHHNNATPILHSLDIPSLLSTMKSCPFTWKKDTVPLSCPNPTINGQITSSLLRIDIHERPLDQCRSESSSNDLSMEIETQTESEAQIGVNAHNSNIHDNDHLNAKTNESDLIPGYYEGGLKVWECSVDLCNHLLHLFHAKHSDLDLAIGQGGRIMELGCGHGLPGCLLVKLFYEKFHASNDSATATANSSTCTTAIPHNCDIKDFMTVFTDYNGFVLRDVTLPNLILNIGDSTRDGSTVPAVQEISSCCTLIAGDWHDLSRTLRANPNDDGQQQAGEKCKKCTDNSLRIPEKYHMILAAETTYTLQSAEDTAFLLLHHLEPLTGIGFVATKRYYFGVGGGSDAFQDACEKLLLEQHDDSRYGLKVELVKEYKDGISNIRDLWRVQCVKN